MTVRGMMGIGDVCSDRGTDSDRENRLTKDASVQYTSVSSENTVSGGGYVIQGTMTVRGQGLQPLHCKGFMIDHLLNGE